MLPYIRASHLVCIEETMQSTPVCQWKFWRVNAWRMQERLTPALFVPVFAGKSLDDWCAKCRKANLESKQARQENLNSLQAGGGKQRGERRGKVWSGKRKCYKS